ncbi:MAG: hypothetical protein ACR2QQ_08415 [Gammaproteobacteria bacterium]
MKLSCYRCGHSLEALTLPLSRRDECPGCRVDVHVCRMCVYYDPNVPKACTEDDALEVKEKARSNFCDYFKPSDAVFEPGEMEAEVAARAQLDSLFGEGLAESDASTDNPAIGAAEDLFKK